MGLSAAAVTALGAIFLYIYGGMATAVRSGVISRLCDNRRKGGVMVAATAATWAGCLLLAAGIRLHAGGGYFAACYVLLALSSGFSTIFIAGCANLSGIVLNHYAGQAVRTATSVVYPPAAYATLFWVMSALAAGSFVTSLFTRETYGRHL